MKLDLHDLKPQEATFTLSEKPGKTYTLVKMSLRVQIWVNERFGKERVTNILGNASIPELSEIVYFMVKDKTDFPTLESFQECIVTQGDRESMLAAMITSVGISQPVLEKMSKDYDDEKKNLEQTGQSTMISSPQSTATA